MLFKDVKKKADYNVLFQHDMHERCLQNPFDKNTFIDDQKVKM